MSQAIIKLLKRYVGIPIAAIGMTLALCLVVLLMKITGEYQTGDVKRSWQSVKDFTLKLWCKYE